GPGRQAVLRRGGCAIAMTTNRSKLTNRSNAALAERADPTRIFTLRVFRFVVVLATLSALPAFAVPPVRVMYTDALAREQAIRVALAAADAPLKIEEVRAVLTAYEAVVKEYPASG